MFDEDSSDVNWDKTSATLKKEPNDKSWMNCTTGKIKVEYEIMDNSKSAIWDSDDGSESKIKVDYEPSEKIGSVRDISGEDSEGLWSTDVEKVFQEALAIYPPCGRRKVIVSNEGKMYGRNELIARYISLRTGKHRTRKQVSSHLQVLAKRKLHGIQAKLKEVNSLEKREAIGKTLMTISKLSSSQIVHVTTPKMESLEDFVPVPGPSRILNYRSPTNNNVTYAPNPPVTIPPPKLILDEFSAFMETTDPPRKHLFLCIDSPIVPRQNIETVNVEQIYDKFPERNGLKDLFEKGPESAFYLVKFWGDLNYDIRDEASAFYAVTSIFRSDYNMVISSSTKVCSFSRQVVEKVETEYGQQHGNKYIYRISRSPMCEYMINFIKKLKQLPEQYNKNSVLENFTVLQVVTNRETNEILLCLAFVFEVSTSEAGAQHHIYKLV